MSTLRARAEQLRSTATVNRRMVDMTRVRAPVRHLVLPGHELGAVELRDGETIEALVERSGWASRINGMWSFRLPTICVLNGKPLLQRMWRKAVLKVGDLLEFWSKPYGGSSGSGVTGKQVLGLVALVALAAFAPWAAVNLLGFAAGSFGAAAAAGIITLGGALLISALTSPKPGGQNDTSSAADQVYSVSASGNTEALLQPIPVQYGRVKSYPNFAISPWSEFEGQDQYLNVLLSVGMGEYTYENVFIDDTILWDSTSGVSEQFEGVQVAFYEPDDEVTLFAVNVTQSPEVSGQDLPDPALNPPGWIGGFIANAAGSVASALALDFVFPGGLYALGGDKGNTTEQWSVPLIAEARPVNDAGAPLGAFVEILNETIIATSRNPLRISRKITVTPGRYEVRVRRDSTPLAVSTDPNRPGGSDDVVWAGLRSFIKGPNSFPVSTVAIRIKANSQVSTSASRKFGVLCTRKLQVWDGEQFVTQSTRNAAWAFLDAAIDTTYGAKRPLDKIDFQGIVDLAAAGTVRGDNFDFRFNAGVAAPSAFDTILKSTRTRHRWSGDVLTIVRDEWSDTPRMLLTDREIVRGSLSIDYSLNTDDSADAVIVEYLDEDTWQPADVQYPPNSDSFTAVQPSRIRIDGVVSRDHAYREAGFYYLCSQKRRVFVTFDTEHDGRMLGFGSRFRLQTELPQTWGYGGCVAAVSGTALTLDPPPVWTQGQSHYIAIRDKTGRQFGPVLCTQGVDAAHAVLDAGDLAQVVASQNTTLSAAIARRDGADDPSFEFGPGNLRARDCVVVSGRPNGDRVTIVALVDDRSVHDGDLGGTPVVPTEFALKDPKAPVITALSAIFRQGVAEPIVDVSWQPAAGAFYYNASVSYDSGVTWTPIYQGEDTKCSSVVDLAALFVRVQGVGKRQGAWYQIAVSPPTIVIAPGTVTPDSFVDGLRDAVTKEFNDIIARADKTAQLIASVAAEQDAANWLDKAEAKGLVKETKTTLTDSVGSTNATVATLAASLATTQGAFSTYQTVVSAQFGNVQSQINLNANAISTANNAFASYQAQVSAQVGNLQSSVTTNATAIATVSGKVAGQYTVTLDANGYVSGLKAYNDGSSSQFVIITDDFLIAQPGRSGGAPKPVFAIASVNGTPTLALRGDLLADGTISTPTLIANNVIVRGHLQADTATYMQFVQGADNILQFNQFCLQTNMVFPVAVGQVWLQGFVIVSCTWNNTSSNAFYYELWIDGAFWGRMQLPQFSSGSQISTGGAIPFQTVLNLSPGNHTFTSYITSNGDGTGFVTLATAAAPSMVAFEARR